MMPPNLSDLFPRASKSFLSRNATHPAPVATRLSRQESQPDERPQPVGAQASPRGGPARLAVIITRCSSGTLDRDNLHGAAKALCDALRYAGHIPGDRECDIELFAFQRKVRRAESGTLIEIMPLPREEPASTN